MRIIVNFALEMVYRKAFTLCGIMVLSENKSNAVSHCMIVELLPAVLMHHVRPNRLFVCTSGEQSDEDPRGSDG